MMTENGRRVLLEGFDHAVAPVAGGNGDGRIDWNPVLSSGRNAGRRRVIGLMTFTVCNCTGPGGSKTAAPGSGQIDPSQSAYTEAGRRGLLDADTGFCRGVQALPNGGTVPCCCQVTVNQPAGPAGAAPTDPLAEALPRTPLTLAVRLIGPGDPPSDVGVRLTRPGGVTAEQKLSGTAAEPWGGDRVFDFGPVHPTRPVEVAVGKFGHATAFVSGPPPAGPPDPGLFLDQDIDRDGAGWVNVNRYRIRFRVPVDWWPVGSAGRGVRAGKPVRVLDFHRQKPTAAELAADLLARFEVYFNGGTEFLGEGAGRLPPAVVGRATGEAGGANLARVVRVARGPVTAFGFQFDVWLGAVFGLGVDVPDVHVDWVRVLGADAGRGFTVQTVRRTAPDWSAPGLELAAVLSPVAAAVTEVNRRHFLAGRRAWAIDPVGPDAPDEFYLETAGVERYAGLLHDTVTGGPLGRLATADGESVRKAVDGVWSNLLVNYVAARRFEAVPPAGGPGWVPSTVHPEVEQSAGHFRPADLGRVRWVREVFDRHPRLKAQFPAGREVGPAGLRPGVWVFARGLAAAPGRAGLLAAVGTHQFLVLVPDRPGDWPDARDLGDRTAGLVVGAHNVAGKLVVREFEPSDVAAVREYLDPAVGEPTFRADAAPVALGSLTVAGAVTAVMRAVRGNARRLPGDYPSVLGQLNPWCVNSNSWVQSVIDTAIGRGRVREDFPGADTCHQNRLPAEAFGRPGATSGW